MLSAISFPALDRENREALPATVVAIGELHLTGNLIPPSWYRHLKLPSGHTDLVACTILGEIIYQYRPLAVRDENTGVVMHHVKRFARDQFCAPLAYFEKKFELTKDQVRQALKRLERAGLIRREYRTITVAGRLVHGMTFIEPAPAAIRAITPPTSGAPSRGPRPGAINPEPKPVSRSVPVVTKLEEGVSAPHSAVATPEGTVQIPLYRDTSKYSSDEPTTPPTSPPVAIPSAPESRCCRGTECDKSSALIPSPQNQANVPPQTANHVPDSVDTLEVTNAADIVAATSQSPEIPDIEDSIAPADAVTPPLLFDFHLARLTEPEKVVLCQRLARLPAPLNQHVLDEYNSAVGRGTLFRNKWGWIEYLIRKAQCGEFIPTSDLAERRQAQVSHPIAELKDIAVVQVVSAVWQSHRDELRTRLASSDFVAYVLPLRGVEQGDRLWLEAPNSYSVDWVKVHWAVFEQVLKPHTPLKLGVRVEAG